MLCISASVFSKITRENTVSIGMRDVGPPTLRGLAGGGGSRGTSPGHTVTA